ncbi:FkbM family methyltransferase [Ruegeria atlantica]|uniref:FkbM family methyltransferase n=1 Tax=Ruegeria atlantica TaxID=81569 RepID=UPI00147A8FA5|nr:FkbM family methyltransferase [Ruegeria atlantica]
MKKELTRRARVLVKEGGPVGALARLSAVANPDGVVFDIGVNRGTIARHLIRVFPDHPCYLFEPLPGQAAYVAERFSGFDTVTVVEEALSDEPGEAEFFVGKALGTSSLLSSNTTTLEQHPEAEVDTSIRVKLNTVDVFCEQNGISQISCMKIDAQGSELNIFKGAEKMLSEQRVDMIMFEWFATPHYENCPLLLDLWNALDRQNYSLYNIFPGRHFANGQRRFGDAVFISDKFRSERLPHL